jgi:predicted transcriptional regulator
MEVQLTPEQEARLAQIASFAGVGPERLVADALLQLIDDDVQFREAVRKGIEQANRGELIDETEMDARFTRTLRA